MSESNIMDLFDTQFLESQMFWVAVSFTALLLLVWKFVVPAVTEVLDGRATTIRDDLDKAASLRNEASQMLVSYEKQLKAARQEATDIVNKARTEAENVANAKHAELNAELQRKAEEASQHIEQSKNAALEDLRTQVAEMAVMAAEKIIGSEVDSGKASKYADEAITKLN